MKAEQSLLKMINSTNTRKDNVPRFKRWSKQEEELLISNYKKKNVIELCELLGRTERSVRDRIYLLKDRGRLKGSGKRIRAHNAWDAKDEKYLIENYPRKTVSDIAKRLKQPETRVWNKIHRMIKQGVLSQSDHFRAVSRLWSKEDEEYLRHNYKKCSYKELAHKLDRSVGGIKGKIRELIN